MSTTLTSEKEREREIAMTSYLHCCITYQTTHDIINRDACCENINSIIINM